jgi:membrane protease YdiL (CAAX protease family)
MTAKALVRRFFAVDKIRLLFSALRGAHENAPAATCDTITVAVAILIAALPLLSFYAGNSDLDYSTLLVGIAACLSIVYRVRNQIPFLRVGAWKRSLSLTHIAFALGCIPTLIILLMSPQALFHLSPPVSHASPNAAPITLFQIATIVLGTATWAAVTEEFIYRGLLIGVLRRWQAFPNPVTRDTVAVVVSALIFGLAHLPSWGPVMSIALFGLGLGFGMAYLAIGEVLLPLVVYHILFDTLSLSFAIFSR